MFTSKVVFNTFYDKHDFDNITERLFELSNLSSQNNKSFVLVSSIFHNENICVAPTVKEAHDIIEIEEIERDLLLWWS